MTIPIKIQCGCGQRYAFDVEPVNGRMASVVACPVCGADGTVAANAIIAQSLQRPAVACEPALGLPVATLAADIQPAVSASAPPRGALLPGQLEPAQAETEARSKIFWGDPAEDVVQFLIMHAFSRPDASAFVQAMVDQRTTALRRIGIWKIVTGIALMAVPVVVFLIMAHFGVILLKLLAIAVMVGLWGAWKVFKGLFIVLAPKMETGDVADL